MQEDVLTNASIGGRPIPGYSWTKREKRISDEQIKEWLLELIAGEEQAYGYRKLTKSLQEEYGLIINKKKVDILEPQCKLRPKHPRRITKNWSYVHWKRLFENILTRLWGNSIVDNSIFVT